MKSYINTKTLRKEIRLVGLTIEGLAKDIGMTERGMHYILSKGTTKISTLSSIVKRLQKAGSQSQIINFIK